MGFVSGAMSGMPQMPQQPGQPIPPQGGKGPVPMGGFMGGGGNPIPPQGGKGQQPGLTGIDPNYRPEGYVSPYANYGFDPGFSQYLDNQYYSTRGMDGGHWNYDPTNQMFTNVGGMRAPGSGPDPTLSLANMQRTYEIQNQLQSMTPKPGEIMSNMDLQNYARSNPDFMRLQNELYGIYNPGKTMPNPLNKPGIPSQGGKAPTAPSPTRLPPTPTRPFNRDNESRRDPRSALQQIQEMLTGQPQMPQQPDRGVRPPPGQVRPPNMPFYQNPNPGTYGAVNNNGVTAQTPGQPQPANPQRGLGALQTDKFRRRLG